ncbi:tRNA adenosine(34) deaminase TadA [Deferribacterales bacterium RsTz2092]|nr:tRNA-specific adenosine deaminase [Deferribacterales bacterium]
MTDIAKMRVAIDEAQRAADELETPIGAALFINDELLSAEHNRKEQRRQATAHAEILAIERACEIVGNWRLIGAELFVTAEPCFMCAGAILQARIARVVFGVCEPKFGGVISRAQLFDADGLNHRVNYSYGLCADEIAEAMQTFFRMLRER